MHPKILKSTPSSIEIQKNRKLLLDTTMTEPERKSRRKSLEANICDAVQSLGDGKGSSAKSILHFLRSHGEDVPTLGDLKVALKSAVDRRELQQTDDGLYLTARKRCGRSRRRSKRRKSRRSVCKSRRRRTSRSRSRRSRSRRRRSGSRRRCGKSSRRGKSRRRSMRRTRRKSRKSRRRGCRRPCTRMWRPTRKHRGRKGRKCQEADHDHDTVDVPSNKQSHD